MEWKGNDYRIIPEATPVAGKEQREFSHWLWNDDKATPQKRSLLVAIKNLLSIGRIGYATFKGRFTLK